MNAEVIVIKNILLIIIWWKSSISETHNFEQIGKTMLETYLLCEFGNHHHSKIPLDIQKS